MWRRTGQKAGRKGPRVLLLRNMKYLYFFTSICLLLNSHAMVPQSKHLHTVTSCYSRLCCNRSCRSISKLNKMSFLTDRARWWDEAVMRVMLA